MAEPAKDAQPSLSEGLIRALTLERGGERHALLICPYPFDPNVETEYFAHDTCFYRQRIEELEEKITELELENLILAAEQEEGVKE